nr:nucleotidyltransferase [Vagococcus vulneris]
MLTSCGVIVEYNPFHNGHRYHVLEARKRSKSDVVVAVMSGNFLQRGEPACMDKWIRAQQALKNGVDLVIELPTVYSVQSADYFADGAVKLLHSLRVDSLCFGTDITGDLDYERFGRFNYENQQLIDEEYQKIKNNGMSYPQQMTSVYRKLFPEWLLDFSSPNHILGMAYAKSNAAYDFPMSLYPVTRQGSGFHDTTFEQQKYASATGIRKLLAEKNIDSLKDVVPFETYFDCLNESIVSWVDFWPFLKYKIQTTSVAELSQIYQMSEGLEYRLKEYINGATGLDDFIKKIKSKRYTRTRLQRLCVYLLLNLTQQEVQTVWENPYLRILGFNSIGQQFLKQQKKIINKPLITNVNQKNTKLMDVDIKAGLVYSNAVHDSQDFYRKPIVID